MVVVDDCVAAMRQLPVSSVDAIVTDPPYGLGFMGKKWDDLPPGVEWAAECLRVLKPGGHLLAFGGTRTYHRLACAVEDAGLEVRDCIMWLYGSGFPKSHNLAGDWDGWGTALKPAHEPIVVARKPLVGTVAQNVAEFGTGAVNVDGCRIATGDDLNGGAYSKDRKPSESEWVKHGGTIHSSTGREFEPPPGRWPANVILDPEAAALLDEQAPDTGGGGFCGGGIGEGDVYGAPGSGVTRITGRVDQNGGASRFFYVAKASSRERNAGVDDRNCHPTVKPISLMRYLCRLVTPPGGIVLDPFTGSGTTGCAAALEGFEFVGIERDAEYARIAEERIAWWKRHVGEGETEAILDAAEARDVTLAAGQMGLLDEGAM